MTDIYVLDGMTKIIEDKVGIIYAISLDTPAIVHKIGNYSKVKKVWEKRREQYKQLEDTLRDFGQQYHFLQLPTTPEVSELHNSNFLESFMLENNIHPLRTEKLPFEQQAA
jgi:hypothetical protein